MAKRKLGGRRPGIILNLAVASLAAAGLGFAAFAMPAGLFESLVARTGLPDMLTAAQPPLGMKARAAAVAVVALLAFGSTLALLGALDRLAARPRTKSAEPADEAAPRVRRADVHPDAPTRRPLLAGRELSDPDAPFEDAALEAERFDDMAGEAPHRPLPGFLLPDEEARQEAEFTPEPEVPEEDEALILDQPLDEGALESLVAKLPDGPEEDEANSITDLMRRLEGGLSRREQAAAALSDAPVPDEPVPAPPEPDPHASGFADEAPPAPLEPAPLEPEPVEPVRQAEDIQVGHRLRNAIGEMQKMAGRAG